MTPRVSLEDILLAIQRVKRIGVRDLKGRGQHANVRQARLLFHFVASQCFGFTSTEIAQVIGRDKTTVSDVVKKLCAETRVSPNLVDQVEDLAVAMREQRLSSATSLSPTIHAQGAR